MSLRARAGPSLRSGSQFTYCTCEITVCGSVLDLRVVIIVVIASALALQVLRRAHGTIVIGVHDFDPAIHIGKFYAGSAAAQFAAQTVADILVMRHRQPEIIGDAARNSARF